MHDSADDSLVGVLGQFEHDGCDAGVGQKHCAVCILLGVDRREDHVRGIQLVLRQERFVVGLERVTCTKMTEDETEATGDR